MNSFLNIPNIAAKAVLAIAMSAYGSSLYATMAFRLPFEDGASASLDNFGTLGGSAASVPSPYGIAPAPTASSTQVYSGSWSQHCTPNGSNLIYSGNVLLPNSISQFQMNSMSSRMTISAWVYWHGPVGSNTRYGIANTLTVSHDAGWTLYIDNNGKVGYRFNIAQSGQNYTRDRVTTAPVVAAGQWTHISATVNSAATDNTAVAIYVNGVAQPTTGSVITSAVHAPSAGLEIALGSYCHAPGGGGHYSLNGYLDDFRMWDSVLSPAKLLAINEAPSVLPGYTSDVMEALFSAYENQGSLAVDDLTWNYATGFDVSGRSLGDVWKGVGGKYFMWLGGPSQSPLGLLATPKRKAFAHYMGCYPIGYSALPWQLDRLAASLDPWSTTAQSAVGGGITNWPLIPLTHVLNSMTPAQSAELDIKRAIRAGFDGFAIDAWAGNDGAKATLNELFAAAERLGVDFELTICLDPACHVVPPGGVMVGPFSDSVNWLINNHGDSPNLARRHGKVLIFGYQTHGILQDAAFKSSPETPEKWAQIVAAWEQLRSSVSEPLFIHFDMDNMVLKTPSMKVEIAAWAGANFEAVGGFLGELQGNVWSQDPAVATAAKNAGAEWSQPVFPQYNNKGGGIFVEPGTDKIRNAFLAAMGSGSTLLQVVTWNDYGEDTIIAPGYSTNYTLMNLHRYYVDWWKSGSEPMVTQDQIHLVFRRTIDGALTWPFATRRQLAFGILEVNTMLTAPGTVTVPGAGSYQAPAGLYVKQLPLQVGSVSASLSRGGSTVLSVTAPEQVTDKPFREDNAMSCYSSNFLAEWTLDFGSTPPLYYSEYGDVDTDGLPNWFEMLYGGHFPYMDTASSVSPAANPDQDNFTNLQEYQNRTDPEKVDVPYPVGYLWDMSHIQARGLSFNPDQDTYRKNVWFYLFQHGAEQAIPHGGNYRFTTSIGNVPYAGLMAHLSPNFDPDGLTYNTPDIFHGWIARRQSGSTWQTVLRPRDNAAVILGWRSPVNGVVSLSFNVAEVIGLNTPLVIDIGRNQESTQLASVSVVPGQAGGLAPLSITVQKGDFIYLFSHGWGTYGASYGYLENLKFTLLQNNGR